MKSATEQKLEDAVYQDMQTLAASYVDVPQLRFTIDNPMLAKDKKKMLLLTACGDKHTTLTERFVELVLDEDRENILQFMANSYITLYRQQRRAELREQWSSSRR